MLKIYAGDMIKCRVCGKEFPSMAGLAGHYRIHSQANLQQTLAEILNRQNELLEKILSELEMIHKVLEGLNIVETKIEKTVTSRTIAPAIQEETLPSFLKENPWVQILQKRSGQP